MCKFLIRNTKTHERLGYSDDGMPLVTGDDGVARRYARDDVYIDAYCAEDRAELDKWVADNV